MGTGGDDRQVGLWDCSEEDWKKVKPSLSAKKEVNCVSFSPSEEFLALGSNDLGVRLCDIPNKLVKTLSRCTAGILSTAFSIDSATVFGGTRDCKIRSWDTATAYYRAIIPCISGCKDLVSTASHGLVSGHIDGNVRLWDTRGSNLVHTISGIHTKSILSLSCTSDENSLLCASADSTMTLIDMRTYQIVQRFEDSKLVASRGGGCLSPDGHFAARGSDEGKILFWNMFSGKCESELPNCGQTSITSISWSRNNVLATCDTAGCLVVRKYKPSEK